VRALPWQQQQDQVPGVPAVLQNGSNNSISFSGNVHLHQYNFEQPLFFVLNVDDDIIMLTAGRQFMSSTSEANANSNMASWESYSYRLFVLKLIAPPLLFLNASASSCNSARCALRSIRARFWSPVSTIVEKRFFSVCGGRDILDDGFLCLPPGRSARFFAFFRRQFDELNEIQQKIAISFKSEHLRILGRAFLGWHLGSGFLGPAQKYCKVQ
jgi:hypothetical protein